jgi:hypothetical protein
MTSSSDKTATDTISSIRLNAARQAARGRVKIFMTLEGWGKIERQNRGATG